MKRKTAGPRREWGSLTKRKTKSGVVWIARFFNEEGKRTTRTIGRVRDIRKKDAEKVLGELRRIVQPRQLRSNETLGSFLNVWEPIYAAKSPASHKTNFAQLRQVADYFGEKPMDSITLADCELCMAHMLTKGFRRKLHPNSVRAIVGRLRTVWRKAQAHEVVRGNPWALLELPGHIEKPIPALVVEECDRLVAACPSWIKPLVAVLAETGLRLGEALRLRWEDIKAGRLTVRESKNKHPRTFALSNRALAVFGAIPKARGIGRENLVLGNVMPDKATHLRSLRHLRNACDKAGLESLGFHGMRHSYGYRMAAAGATEVEIADVLGHRDLSITRRYMAHHPGTAAKRAIDKMNAAEGQDISLRAADSASNG